MPYSIETKDGIVINNIPDTVPHDSDELKARVAQIRAGNTQKAEIPVAQASKPSFLENAASDVGNIVGGAAHAVMHPIQTTQNVLNLGAGELSKVLPQSVNEALNRADEAVMGKQKAQQLHAKQEHSAEAINQLYANRYGSMEGFKKAVTEHPVEVAADLSTVLGGAGALTKGSKLGDILSKASEVTNPLTPVTKVVEKVATVPGGVAKQVLGVTTGVGADTVGQAYQAGKAGNKVFMQNLKGEVPMTDVLNEAQNALGSIRQAKNDAYRSGMVDISKDQSVLNFDDVNQALSNAKDKVSYKNQIKDKFANTKVKKAQSEINKWKKLDPAEYHTPEGMDALKQKIGSILESIPYEQKTARSAIQDIYNSTRKTIANQAPTYDKVMKDYSEASDLVTNIEKTLSLNPKASVDTAMRKLQSLTRNNVQTNYGQRVKLAEELAKQPGGENIMPALAGQAMSEWMPRGLIGKGEDIAAILGAAHMSPATLAFPLAMPRVVGAGAYGLGKVAGATPKLPITVDQANKLALMLYQMRNPELTQEEQ